MSKYIDDLYYNIGGRVDGVPVIQMQTAATLLISTALWIDGAVYDLCDLHRNSKHLQQSNGICMMLWFVTQIII